MFYYYLLFRVIWWFGVGYLMSWLTVAPFCVSAEWQNGWQRKLKLNPDILFFL